jgi:hypothetical protein
MISCIVYKLIPRRKAVSGIAAAAVAAPQVPAAPVAAAAATGRKRTATGANITPHRPVWTQPYLNKQYTNYISGLEAIADS